MVLAQAGCSRTADPKAARGGQRPAQVSAQAAGTRDVPVQIRNFGAVEAAASVTIRSQVSGMLTKLAFQEGQYVKQGQLLCQIDPAKFQAALEAAQANLERDDALINAAKNALARETALQEKGISSKSDFDQALAAERTLAGVIHADKAAIQTAQLNLEYCNIVSPVSGRVGKRLADEGNLINANDTQLLVINQVQPVNVYLSVTQAELPLVKRYFAGGEPLRVEAIPPEDSQVPQVGQLFFIDNAIDKSTGMVLLGASFPNAQETLWPGQHVQVVLWLTQRKGVVTVPSQAVQAGREGKYVYVVGGDQTAQLRNVSVGQACGDDVVIEQGLSSGEVVVTDGQFRLAPGAKLEVKPAATAPSTGTCPVAGSSPASQAAPAPSSVPVRRQGRQPASAPARGISA